MDLSEWLSKSQPSPLSTSLLKRVSRKETSSWRKICLWKLPVEGGEGKATSPLFRHQKGPETSRETVEKKGGETGIGGSI